MPDIQQEAYDPLSNSIFENYDYSEIKLELDTEALNEAEKIVEALADGEAPSPEILESAMNNVAANVLKKFSTKPR